MSDRSERLKALRRIEDRNKRLPELLEALSSIAGESFTEKDVLTLEEIDAREIMGNRSDFEFNFLNVSYPVEKLSDLIIVLNALAIELNNVNCLSLNKWVQIAELKVNTGFVIEHMRSLVELDGDSVYLSDIAYENGIWIDRYREWWYLGGSARMRDIFELRVFGKSWMKKVAAAM